MPQIYYENYHFNVTVIIKSILHFLTAQFRLASYHLPYYLDISDKRGSILVYIKSNISTYQLNCRNLCKSIQAVSFEKNSRKKKWLVISIYRSPSQNSKFFLNSFKNIIDHFTKHFENYTIIGDFHLEQTNTTLKHFLDCDGLKDILALRVKIRINQILLKILNCLKLVWVIIIIWFILCSKLLSRNLKRNHWFTEIFKTSILKVSKKNYLKI